MFQPTAAPPRTPDGASLLSRSGVHHLDVRRAATFGARLRGLMLRPPLAPDAGLLLADCPGVHTAFMRCAIDLLYLDRHGVVLKCVADLRPWRASDSRAGRDAAGRRHRRAAHTLELAAGSIARWQLAPGDRLRHPLWFAPAAPPPRQPGRRQRGAALIELVVVGPLLTMMGLGVTQYSQLFFAKNQLNHATMLAARAGSVGNASIDSIKQAYAAGLVPLFGGGSNAAELAESLANARKSVDENAYVDMLNPTKEAFADFNDPALQATLKTGSKRVISNRGLAFKSQQVGATSGETIQDANLIKLRIIHGISPAVPIVGRIYKAYLQWQDTGEDPRMTNLISKGLVPVVSHVTLQMQSDAIEPATPTSSPGAGNGGSPTDPGDPPVTSQPPPDCPQGSCGESPPPTPPGDGGYCQAPIVTNLSADTLFGFDQANLQISGILQLKSLLASARGQHYDSLTVTGYTDQIGSDAYNLDLSRRRAQAVRDYLIDNGLVVDHVDVVGAGATDFIVSAEQCAGKSGTDLQTCYAKNRRVIVELKPKN
ncbi:OmpA family protein [Rugamonas sp. CCM 8940]|uniref:OmpA family protein n=2 Tax=Rugamonas sp. CCM 8940 TaxID=2765359 RepID=UPI00360BAC57